MSIRDRAKLWARRIDDLPSKISDEDMRFLKEARDPFINELCLMNEEHYTKYMQLLECMAAVKPFVRGRFNSLGPSFQKTFPDHRIFWRRWRIIVAIRNWIAHNYPVVAWNDKKGPVDTSVVSLNQMKSVLDEGGLKLCVHNK